MKKVSSLHANVCPCVHESETISFWSGNIFSEERSWSLSSRARRCVFADLEMMAARMEKAIS